MRALSRVFNRSNSTPPALQERNSSPCPGANPDDVEQVPPRVAALLTRAAEMRPLFAAADAQRDKIRVDQLATAFEMATEAADEAAKAAIASEAKRLGARPNRRSRIEHLVVDVLWPPGTISPSLRTRHAQAVHAGLQRGYTTGEFKRIAAEGASGKGGIRHLAKIGRGFAHGSKAPTASSPAGIDPSPDPKRSAHATDVGQPIPLREKGFPRAVIVPEPVVASLLASDLKTGDLFQLVVRVTATNGLEAVKYLRPRRTS